jgi:signal transduction histidine kinase
MQPLLSLSCADEARHQAIAGALARSALELVATDADLAIVHIVDGSEGLLIHTEEDVLLQLAVSPAPEDVACLARLAVELTTLWATVRAFEDAESHGVIAMSVAEEARAALVPVMFAAEALASECREAQELATLLVEGCRRVANILHRITPPDPDERSDKTLVCANATISGLLRALRALVQPGMLVTQLETPLPPVAFERPQLERMLLTLVANASDRRRGSVRVVVRTLSRTITRVAPGGPPLGAWTVIEIEDDGEPLSSDERDRALEPTFRSVLEPYAGGLGLPSLSRIARSAGGHLSISTHSRGTTVGVWLPRAGP